MEDGETGIRGVKGFCEGCGEVTAAKERVKVAWWTALLWVGMVMLIGKWAVLVGLGLGSALMIQCYSCSKCGKEVYAGGYIGAYRNRGRLDTYSLIYPFYALPISLLLIWLLYELHLSPSWSYFSSLCPASKPVSQDCELAFTNETIWWRGWFLGWTNVSCAAVMMDYTQDHQVDVEVCGEALGQYTVGVLLEFKGIMRDVSRRKVETSEVQVLSYFPFLQDFDWETPEEPPDPT